MADDLEPIRQEFIADLAPYVEPMNEGEHEAHQFAEANRLAAEEIKALARAVTENTAEIRRLADALIEDNHELGKLRDKSAEAAAELGHLRDEALEAAAAERILGESANKAQRELDLMGLSGASTLAHLAPMLGMIGALVVAASAVAPALVAAGLGLGSFGLFAIPTIKTVTGALKDNASQLAKLPAPIQEAVHNIKSLEAEYKGLAKTMQGPTLQVFNQVLAVAASLLPKLVPLAQQGAIAFGHIATALGKGINSTGFANFLHLMTSMIVPATDAIIHLSGALTGVLGNALTQLAPMSIPFINFLTSLVRALSGPLAAALSVVVRLFMGLATAITPLLPGLSHLATLLINDIGRGFQGFIPILSQVIGLLGGSLIQILTSLEPIFAALLTPNSGFMLALGMIPGLLRAILPLFTGLASILGNPIFARLAVDAITLIVAFKGLTAIIGMLRVAFIFLGAAMAINPIILVATAIAILVVAFITLWQRSEAFRNFWKGLWHDILAIVRAVWAVIGPIVHTAMTLITGYVRANMAIIEGIWKAVWATLSIIVRTVWNVIKAVVQGALQTIRGIIQFVMDVIHGHWSAAWHDLVNIARAQITMVASVIRSVASGFINILFTAGRNIIQGLINGVTSMIGAVVSTIGHIGSMISGAFSGVLHMFSPSQVFHDHGRNTMLGYINGVMSLLPTVKATMATAAGIMQPPRLALSQLYGGAGATAPAPGPGSVGGQGGGGQGSPQTIIVQVDGQKLFQVMQNQTFWYNVRNSGQVTGVVRPTG